MHYLDQLLGIQCERILNRSRKKDTRDDIYDLDTVHGSFIWKNELRIHWARSRIERRRLLQEQIKPLTNPFIPVDRKKKKTSRTPSKKENDDGFEMADTPRSIYEEAVLDDGENEEDGDEES